MGIPIFTLFGDKTKEELEKALKEIESEEARLAKEKGEIKKALEKYDGAAKG